jgi:hypothetical protein
MKKVVLAYSGGLDTSVAVAWLREQYDVEVVTLTVDLGGGVLKEDVDRRAISAGASRAYVVDGRERFVRDFCWPHVQAGALYQGVYPLATAMARPMIAQLLVEVAHKEGADAVAHGCTGKGNDQVRFDVATHALDPSSPSSPRCASAWACPRAGDRVRQGPQHRDHHLQGVDLLDRREPVGPLDRGRHPRGSLDRAARRRLPLDRRSGQGARADGHRHRLRGRRAGLARRRAARSGGSSSACTSWPGPTASAASTTSRTAWSASRAARSTRRRPPRSSTAPIAPWRADAQQGHAPLQPDRGRRNRPAHLRRPLVQLPAPRPARLRGQQPARRQRRRPRPLDHGNAIVTGRRSPLSLYEKSLATYEADDAYDHAAAVGFIEIFGLPLRTEAARHGAVGKSHGAAWTWTEPLLEDLPTKVYDAERPPVA